MQFVYGTLGTPVEVGECLYYHRDSLIDWKGELFDYGDSVPLAGLPLGARRRGDLDALARRPRRARLRERQVRRDRRQVRRPRRQVHLEPDPRPGDRPGRRGRAGPAAGTRSRRLYRDWTLANLLDGKVTEAEWNYRNLVLGGVDSDG